MTSNKYDFKDKVAIITGSSRGIGKAIAVKLYKSGCNVIINGRNEKDLNSIHKKYKNTNKITPIAGNVSKSEDLENLISKTIKKYNRLDILVNNAATNPIFGPIENVEKKTFEKIQSVNLHSIFELTNKCFSYLKKTEGKILNISSVTGIKPVVYLGPYSVSKSAIISLTKIYAKEWAKYNIRTNVICPGLIKTKFSEMLWNDEETLKKFLKQVPLNKIGNSDDVANLALFLVSNLSNYCNGGVYNVDGGLLA